MVSSMSTTNQQYLPKKVTLRTKFNFDSIFYVRYKSEEISPYTKLNDENDSRFFWNIITIHSNLTPPKTSPTLYEIGTCSYGSYTKLNDENDSRFFWNIITVHSNLTPPKNVPHPVWNWDKLVWVIYQAQWWKRQ